MKKTHYIASKKSNITKTTKKSNSKNKSPFKLRKITFKKINKIVLKQTINLIKRTSKNYKTKTIIMNSILMKQNIKRIRYLMPMSSLFFSAVSLVYREKPLFFRSLYFSLKKQLCHLKIINKKIQLLNKLKLKRFLLLKLFTNLLKVEKFMIKNISIFKTSFFSLLKKLQLAHTKNTHISHSKVGVSFFKKHKTARWMCRTPFRKWKMWSFSNYYASNLLKSLCLKVYFKFAKIKKITKKSTKIQKVIKDLSFNTRIFDKKKLYKKSKINKKRLKFIKWRWLNAKLNGRKKLRIFFVKNKKIVLKSKRKHLIVKLGYIYNKLKLRLSGKKKKYFKLKIKLRFKRLFKSKVFVKKFKRNRFNLPIISDYFRTNLALIKSKNSLFFNRLPKKNIIPFKVLVKMLKNTYNRSFYNTFFKISLREKRIQDLIKDIDSIETFSKSLYSKLISPIPGKNLNLIYLALHKNNHALWLKKQLLNKLNNIKTPNKKTLQHQQKMRVVFPLTQDFKDLNKLKEIKKIMVNYRIPFYKRLKLARKNINLKKFSFDFYNRKFLELSPSLTTKANSSILKQRTVQMSSKVSKLYKRKLFNARGKSPFITRREFRLNIKNSVNQLFLSNLLMKTSFYRWTLADREAASNYLSVDNLKSKKILSHILQLYGKVVKNYYTRKNGLLFNQLSGLYFRNLNIAKNLRRRNKSASFMNYKEKRKLRNFFHLKKIVVRKYKQLRINPFAKRNRRFNARNKLKLVKKPLKKSFKLKLKSYSKKKMENRFINKNFFKLAKRWLFSFFKKVQSNKLSLKQKASLKIFFLTIFKKPKSGIVLHKLQVTKYLINMYKNRDNFTKRNVITFLLGSSKLSPFVKQKKLMNDKFRINNAKYDYLKFRQKVLSNFKQKNSSIKQYRRKLLTNWKLLSGKQENNALTRLAKLAKNKPLKIDNRFVFNKNLAAIIPQSNNLSQIINTFQQKVLVNLVSHKKATNSLIGALRKHQLKQNYQKIQQRLFLIDNCINLETLTLRYINLIKRYVQVKNKLFLRRRINTSKKDLSRFKKFCSLPWQQLISKQSIKSNKLLISINKKKQYSSVIKSQKVIDIHKINTYILNFTDSNEATTKLNINLQINDKTLFGINYAPLSKMLTVFLNKCSSLDLNKSNPKPSFYKINVKNTKRVTFVFKPQASFLDNVLTRKQNKKIVFYHPSKHVFSSTFILDPVRIFPRDLWIKSNTNFWFSNFKDKFVLKQFKQSKGLKNIMFNSVQQAGNSSSSVVTKKNNIRNYWNNIVTNFKSHSFKAWKQSLLKTYLNQNPAVHYLYKMNLGIKSNLNNKFGWIYNKIYLYNKNKWTKFKHLNKKLKKTRYKKFRNLSKQKNLITNSLLENLLKSDPNVKNRTFRNTLAQSNKTQALKTTIKLQTLHNKKNTFLFKKRVSKWRSRMRKLNYKSKIFKFVRLPFRWKKKQQLKQKLITRIKSKKAKFSFFKRLNRIQINVKNIEKNNFIWQTIYFWRILIEFFNFMPASFNKFINSFNTELNANLFPVAKEHTVKLNKKSISYWANKKEKMEHFNISKLILKQLYKKSISQTPFLKNTIKSIKNPLSKKQTNMLRRFFSTSTKNLKKESLNLHNKKMVKYVTNTQLNKTKLKYICEKYENKTNPLNVTNSLETKFPRFFYWRILAPKFNMLQEKKQRIAKLKYFNSKLKKFRWKKKKKKSLSLFFKFLGTWKRLYLFFKGKKKLEKFLPFIEGDIKIKSLKKFYAMRFIIRRYLRINFFGNIKKNKTIKIYESVKRLQTNRFLKYCSKLRRYVIPALISMQLAQNARMALNLVRHGFVFVNGHKITKVNFLIKPLDLIMIFIPHSSHPYFLQNNHYFAKNLNTNLARVNTIQRPTNFINGSIFPSRFFLINLKLEDWFKFMHYWTAFNSIKASFHHLSRFENTNRLFRWKRGFYSKSSFLKKGRKYSRKAMYPRLLKKRAHIALTEKLWFLKKSAINRFWNRLLKRLVFFSNCYIVFGFYFEDFNVSNKKGLKKLYRNNLTNLTMHILKQYR